MTTLASYCPVIGPEVGPLEDVVDGPGGDGRAVGEKDDGVGEPRDLVDRVADIDDRQPHLVAEPLDIGKELRLPRLVEGGERLVHQQQPGAGEQRAAEGDALLLAAGEPRRPAVEKMADAEKIDDRRRASPSASARAVRRRP